MVKLDNFNENFIENDSEEEMRQAYSFIYNNIFKKEYPDVDYNDEKYYFNFVNNQSDYYVRYKFLQKQLFINDVLQKAMDTTNNLNGEIEVNPFNREKIGTGITDFEKLKTNLLSQNIDIGDIPISDLSLDELRTVLYNSIGVKVYSVSNIYDFKINEPWFGKIYYDAGELLVNGINPESLSHKEEKPYIDGEFLIKTNIIKEYITKGSIFGTDILCERSLKKGKK